MLNGIITAQDVTGLNRIEWITNVHFESATVAPGTLSMNSLKTASGYIEVKTNSNLQLLSFPSLTRVVGKLFIINNPHLVSVSFPKLEYVDGNFEMTQNGVLKTINFASIATVAPEGGRQLYVTCNGAGYRKENGEPHNSCDVAPSITSPSCAKLKNACASSSGCKVNTFQCK